MERYSCLQCFRVCFTVSVVVTPSVSVTEKRSTFLFFLDGGKYFILANGPAAGVSESLALVRLLPSAIKVSSWDQALHKRAVDLPFFDLAPLRILSYRFVQVESGSGTSGRMSGSSSSLSGGAGGVSLVFCISGVVRVVPSGRGRRRSRM